MSAATPAAPAAAARRGPLAGVRVLEFEGVGPGPFAGMQLADLGAEILLISPRSARTSQMPLPPERDPLFRGRARMRLDLKVPADRERVLALLPQVDLLIEGYRPGVMERLGLGPDVCLARAPHLVYGRITGWGQDGPLAHTAGHDPNYIALTGALHAIGYPDRPPLPPLNVLGDFCGGSMFLVSGLLAAYIHAQRTGEGQVIDANIVDGTLSLLTMAYSMRGAGQWSDTRGENLLDGSCPFGTTYETADGHYMAVCALEPHFYAEFIRRLGVPTDGLPSQWERARWTELRARLAAAFRQRSRAEWSTEFEGTDACVTPVLSVAEASAHPHNRARANLVGEPPLPAPAPRFSATPTQIPPALNDETEALLQRWASAAGTRRAGPVP
jgi:alpha-methylacyl-CoA racemase